MHVPVAPYPQSGGTAVQADTTISPTSTLEHARKLTGLSRETAAAPKRAQ
jgi:hypothetical protein